MLAKKAIHNAVRVVALGALLIGGAAAAQTTATSSVDATVNADLSVVNQAPLAFQSFTPGTSGGTVVISPAGSRTKTGTVTLGISGTPTAAKFFITGAAGNTISVTVPHAVDGLDANAKTLTNGTGGTMKLHSFTTDFSSTPTNALGLSTYTETIGADGTKTFHVGGTLDVGASQVTGTYQTTFDVTVAYP